MKNIIAIIIVIAMGTSPVLYAQKGKMKGGGGGGGGNQKVNIKVKTNDSQVKVKTNTKNGQVKINVKDKGGNGGNGNGNNGNVKFKNGHDNGNHYGQYKNKTVWFFGPGDIYMVSGKPRRERIIIFDQVCVRLTTNIGFMFGLLGDIRVKLDAKKAVWKPERVNKLKIEIDLLETDLKLLEIKKQKIKLRLAKLKNDNGKGND